MFSVTYFADKCKDSDPKLIALVSMLLAMGRSDEVEKAILDTSFRSALYKEFAA